MDYPKQQIKTSVVACIVDEQHRVLLTRRSIEPFIGQWVMPGGKIDHGESLLKALHREVAEEVGIEVRIEKLLDVFEHLAVGDSHDHYVILYYLAHPLSRDIQLNHGECSEARWFRHDQLGDLELPDGTRHILHGFYQGAPDRNNH